MLNLELDKVYLKGMGFLEIGQSRQIKYEISIHDWTTRQEDKKYLEEDTGDTASDGEEDRPKKPVKSFREAQFFFNDAAIAGHCGAQYQLGRLIFDGHAGRNANTNGSGAAVELTHNNRLNSIYLGGRSFESATRKERRAAFERARLDSEPADPCLCGSCPFEGKKTERPQVVHERDCCLKRCGFPEYDLCDECGGRPPPGCDPRPMPTASEMRRARTLVTVLVHGFNLPLKILTHVDVPLRHISDIFCAQARLDQRCIDNSGLNSGECVAGRKLDLDRTLISQVAVRRVSGGWYAPVDLNFIYTGKEHDVVGSDTGEEVGTAVFWKHSMSAKQSDKFNWYRPTRSEQADPCSCGSCPFVGKERERPPIEHERGCKYKYKTPLPFNENRLCDECGGRPPPGCDPRPMPTAAEMTLAGTLVTVLVHGYYLPIKILTHVDVPLRHILGIFCAQARLENFIDNSGLSYGGQTLDLDRTLSSQIIVGHAPADLNLIYTGVEPDVGGSDTAEEVGTAASWFAKAAAAGHAEAQYALGSCHIQRYCKYLFDLGRGFFAPYDSDLSFAGSFHDGSLPSTVPRLLQSAFSLLEQSAYQGNSGAQCALGDMFNPRCPMAYLFFGPHPQSNCCPMSFHPWYPTDYST